MKAAAEGITKDVPVINGILQFNRSPLLVKGREPVFEELLSGVYEQHQKALNEVGVNSPKDMSVHYENGIWTVTDARGKELYSASKDGERSPITFTDGHVLKYEAIKRDSVVGQALREEPQSQTGAAIKTFFSDLFSIPKEGYVKLPSQNR